MKNSIKWFCKLLLNKLSNIRTKILVSSFFTGLIFLGLGIYKKNIGQDVTFLSYTTSVFFAIWWILMPLTEKQKNKMLLKTFVYCIMTFITLYTIVYCLEVYFVINPTTSQLILSAILIFTVVIFFVDVFQTLFHIVLPLISKAWGKLSSKEPSPFMNFIKNTMAGLVTVTAFITAIAGLIKLFIP